MAQTKAQLVVGLDVNASAPASALQIDASGNVNLDSNTLYVDATNNRVGIGTSSPASLFHISGSVAVATIEGTSTSSASIQFRTNSNNRYKISTPDSSADLAFYSSGTDERMRLTSGGNVGIGTTSPASLLDVRSGTSPNAANLLVGLSGSNNYFVANNNIFQDGASNERARIDSSGRLLVGTSSAVSADTWNLIQAVDSVGGYLVAARNDTSVVDGDAIGGLRFYGNDSDGNYDECARVECNADGTHTDTSKPSRLRFLTTADSASSPTEQMRITNGGIIAIGNVAATNLNTIQSGTPTSFWISTTGTTSNPPAEFYGNSTGNRFHICFSNSNGVVGSIRTNATATAYLTSSDYRLKENVVAVTDGITRLQQLKPSRFNFIVDPDVTVDGFLAHEAQTVVPECVSGTKDEVDEDGNPIYQGIDQSKLVPLLTAALQEAIGRIETLEAEVAALKAQ